MTRSQLLYERSVHLFPGGVNSPVRKFDPYPVFMESGSGSRLTDVDGNEFIDYCLAFGPMILGHSNEAVISAVKEQAERIVLTGTPVEAEISLGLKIRGAVPSMEMIRYANSGSEAVFHAMRLARAYTGRNKIVKFEGSYHGANDYNLVDLTASGTTSPSSPGIPEATVRTMIVGKYGDIDALRSIFQRDGRDIAAVIVEPVMANAGLLEPDVDFLKAIREITKDNGSLLIFDEVVTGFRFRYGCYQDMIGVRPDLTTLAKIIGGGMPISAFGGRKDIMEMVAPSGKVYVAGTFSGNPLSAAAGNAALKILEKKDYSSLRRYVDEFGDSVERIIERRRADASLNRYLSMFQLFFRKNVRTYRDAMKADKNRYMAFFNHMLRHGVYIPGSQFETLFVSFAHDESDLAATVDAVDSFFREA